MKTNVRIILPLLLLSALLILLVGCMVTPTTDDSPGATPGTIIGTIAAPCCSTSADQVSEPCCIAPDYWCYYCGDIWFLQNDVEVVLTYDGEEVATTNTDENGEYAFFNVPPGKNYVVTAYCPDYEDGRPLVKDVALELMEDGSYDCKITDLVSTSLGLVVDFLVDFTILTSEDILLDDVIADQPDFLNFPKFKALVIEAQRVLEACQDVNTDDDLQYALCEAAEEISGLNIGCGPGYTPGPGPTPNPCDGNASPVISSVEYDSGSGFLSIAPGAEIHVLIGQNYTIRVNATDDGIASSLTYSGTVDGVPFGPNSSSQIAITPSVADEYLISLSVYDGCVTVPWGAVTVIVDDPCIINPPTADANGPYADDAICGSPATITLDGSGSSAGGTPIVSWEWSEETLGDLGSGETLDYDFDPGSYVVTLEVTDENGCTDTDTSDVEITEVDGPTADANGPYADDAICGSPATITLDGSGSSAGGTPIVSWEWSEETLGDLGSGETLDYDFDPGSYVVTLEVTDENGCTDTDTSDVEITEVDGPTADANGPYADDAICGSPATITLDGSGSSAGGTPIVSWEWSEETLGDLGSGETLDYDFDPGSYVVTLEVTDENGCTDTDTSDVEITEVDGPTADANGPYADDAICGSPATITLDGSGSSAGGTPIVSWEWSEETLGDLGSGETLDYDFDPGSYVVTLEVTDENGCTDTDTSDVEITEVDGPTADANGPYADDAICGSPATITLDGSGSSAGGTPIVSWEWSEETLGDLGSGETLDYDFDPGSYVVTLEVTDENGCTDTDTSDVEITGVCDDLNYLFIRGYNSASGCTGLQETHEETPPDVPHLIETGLWLTDQDHTPNVKHINFIARYIGASTTIEYRYRYQIQWLANSSPEPWVAWSAWSTSGASLGENTYGYGFESDCMYAPSKTSNPKYYCNQFEIEIRVNGNVNTYLINID